MSYIHPQYLPYIQGAFWKVLSCLCFAALNGLIRYFSFASSGQEIIPTVEIAFFQYLFECLWLAPFLLLRLRGRGLISKRFDLQGFRIMICVGATFLWYESLRCLPLSLSVALGFLGPIFTSLGAWFFLKEDLHRGRILSIILGILGGIFLSHSHFIQASTSCFALSSPWFLGLPLLSAIGFSSATLLTKKLARFDPPDLIVGYLAFAMCLVFGCCSLFVWVTPSPFQLMLLVGAGGLSLLAQWSMSKAFTCSDVTFLLPFGSIRLIASTLIGWFVFNEFFSWPFVVGSILIFSGLYYLSLFEKRRAT